jgi:Alternative complex III, ActD subunit
MSLEPRFLYGLLAEFEDTEHLLQAARRTRAAGYRTVDAYTPFPVEGLSEAIGFRHTRLPLVVLIGGALGGAGGFFMEWWANVVAYPLNIGGFPHNSWPSFIPITFELTVLGAALSAVLGMLALNGLPQPHHPLFNEPRFELASRDRFFLCIKSKDPRFDRHSTRAFMETLGARHVTEVER